MSHSPQSSAPTFVRPASAADLPPGFRWLRPDESTAAQDMLWDMDQIKWVPITRPYIGLSTRHFTSVIRRWIAPDARPPAPAPAPAPSPIITREQAKARGYKSITSQFTSAEAHILKEVVNTLKAKGAPYLLVTVRNGQKEVWVPKKKTTPLK